MSCVHRQDHDDRQPSGGRIQQSVVADLGLRVRHRPFVKPVSRLVARPRIGTLIRRIVTTLDPWMYRVSSERIVLTALTSGLPVISLTTRGARSGLERTVLVLGVVVGDRLAVIGSNWGQETHPAWVFNLMANPDAVAGHQGHRTPVRGQLVTDETELDQIWTHAVQISPGFAEYPQLAAGRHIKTFWLRPRPEGETAPSVI